MQQLVFPASLGVNYRWVPGRLRPVSQQMGVSALGRNQTF